MAALSESTYFRNLTNPHHFGSEGEHHSAAATGPTPPDMHFFIEWNRRFILGGPPSRKSLAPAGRVITVVPLEEDLEWQYPIFTPW